MSLLEDLRCGGPRLSAGIVSADLLSLGDELDRLDEAGVTLVHVDVMDGVFCPPITVGPPIVRAVAGRLVTDVHLMVSDPLVQAPAAAAAGADIVTFHVEATPHPHRVLAHLDGAVEVRGVALNPGTPVGMLAPLVDHLELVLILAVDPGWGGQVIDPATPDRVHAVREMLAGREVLVGVDGGVDADNVARIAALPVDLVVAGSAVFRGGETVANARALVGAMATV